MAQTFRVCDRKQPKGLKSVPLKQNTRHGNRVYQNRDSLLAHLFLARMIFLWLHQAIQRLVDLQVDLGLARNQRAPTRAGAPQVTRQLCRV